MIGKKINQLATELAPVSTDLTIIGNPTTGVSKKITLAQLGAIFSGAVSFYNDLASFPATGDINVIYCAKDTQKLYLWNGSAYTEVFPSQALLDTYQLRSEKGVSNGYASLDSGGKVPISQLPSSIMEYKGMWNAATNTPTLANGTGDTGDVYICNVAGTVNFGAGPITFAVGDYVIYSGSIWQRSSGAVGTVTSVGLSITGDSIGVSNSPVTTSGTLALAFAGTSGQYINGAGNLTTFPTLTGYVPYTGATANVDLGTHSLSAYDLIINHTSGSGVAASITKGGNGEALTVVKSSGSGNAASITGGVTLLDELHLNTDLADTYIASASNWNAAYNDKINSAAVTGTTTKTLTLTQQDGGTITASWTDDNTDAVTSVFGRTGAVVAVSGDYNTSQVTENTNLYFTNARAIASTLTGYTSGAGTISATDTILSAIQKLNGNIGALTTGVSSVNGLTGAVTLTTSNIAEGTNLYYTEARVSANTDVAANTAARHNAVTIGTANGLSLSAQVLSLALASGSTTGALSSTDWTTFNNKQNALTNPVTGTGTTNYLPKFTGTSTIGDSIVQDNGSTMTIGGSLNLSASSGFPTVGLLNRSSDNALYMVSPASGFTLTDNSLNTIYNATPTSHNWCISNVIKMKLDASGNLGLGVTPSAWGSGLTAFQIGNGAIWKSGSRSVDWIVNGYYDGTNYIYNQTNAATYYRQYDGQHQWYNAPSGTAGNAIGFTQAMTLNASGNLSIGNTNDTYKLDVSGTGRFTSTLRVTNSGTNTLIWAQGGNDAAGQGKGNFRSSDQGGANYFDFGRDNLATGNFVLTSGGGSPLLSIATTGAATFSANSTIVELNTSSRALKITGKDNFYAIEYTGGTTTGQSYGPYIKAGTNSSDQSFVIQNSLGNKDYLTVRGDGNVGIGTASPSEQLSLMGANAYTSKIRFSYGASATSYYANFGYNSDGNKVYLQIADGSSAANIMTWNYNGNVGIGTTSPDSLLEVENASNPSIFITNTGAATLRLQAATGVVYVGSKTSDALDFITGDAPRMRITSGGNVGIGTTNPNSKLQIFGGDSSNPTLKINASIYPMMDFISDDANSGNRNWRIASVYNSYGTFEILSSTTSGGTPTTSRFAITSGGNVVIGGTSFSGVSSGSTGLEVKGPNAQLLINNQSYNWFTIYSASDSNIYNVFGTSGSYLIGTGNKDTSSWSEKMRITSGGNVGIGVTSVNGLLSLKANKSNTPILRFQNQDGGPDSAISTYTTSAQTYTLIGHNIYVDSSGNAPRFNTSYPSCGIAFDEGDLRFLTGNSSANASSKLTIASTGLATFSGDVKVKTLEVTNVGTDSTSSGVSTYMQITVNGNPYLIPLHGTP